MADPMVRALGAYQATLARPLVDESQGIGPGALSGGPSFAEVLGQAARRVVDNSRQAETVSAAALVGKADLSDVVLAINQAELTLQGVIAVRDKVVQAYREVLQMPI